MLVHVIWNTVIKYWNPNTSLFNHSKYCHIIFTVLGKQISCAVDISLKFEFRELEVGASRDEEDRKWRSPRTHWTALSSSTPLTKSQVSFSTCTSKSRRKFSPILWTPTFEIKQYLIEIVESNSFIYSVLQDITMEFDSRCAEYKDLVCVFPSFLDSNFLPWELWFDLRVPGIGSHRKRGEANASEKARRPNARSQTRDSKVPEADARRFSFPNSAQADHQRNSSVPKSASDSRRQSAATSARLWVELSK